MRRGQGLILIALMFVSVSAARPSAAQEREASNPVSTPAPFRANQPQENHQRSAQPLAPIDSLGANLSGGDYQIGPEDLLEVSVLEAPDMSRTVRVSDDGAISLPLLGSVEAAGLTTRQLQAALERRLRQTYMKDPQVNVFVKEMRSHPVSVFGAVEKPGVYQIRNAKTLVEVLSMARGLAADAGDTVIVVRHGADPGDRTQATSSTTSTPMSQGSSSAESATVRVRVKDLLDSRNSSSNVIVYPGDAVKVTRAGIVYVVGEVRKPGGFLLKTNENISVLQALALAEGMTPTSNGKRARIIVANARSGSRHDISINLAKVLAGKAPDPLLKANDILFVPNSSAKSALHGFAQSTAMIVASVGGAAVYRW